MLKLFRTIRKKLMEQNKIRAYIIYAMGEIALVMIGILLALQVNNWNQERIENNELTASLNSISKNMSQDIEAARSMLVEKDSARVLANEYLQLKRPDDVEPSRFFEMVEAIFVEDYLTINDSGFEALKNSGLLGELRDTEFESLIYQYYNTVQEARYQEVSTNEFIEAMEAAAAEKGTFKGLFSIYADPNSATPEVLNQTLQVVLDDPAVSAAAGRVAIDGYLYQQFEALIESGTRFIKLVKELD